jgi:hypothetical protein
LAEKTGAFGIERQADLMQAHNPTTIEIQATITEEQQTAGSLSLPVSSVSHLHRITKQSVIQRLVGRLARYHTQWEWKTDFIPIEHMNPEIQEGEDRQNAKGQKI